MKILHLIESGGLYGAERVVLDLAAAQRQLGDEPIILSVGRPGEPQKALEREALARHLTLQPWRMRAGLNLVGMRQIFRWGQAQGIEVYHSHGYRFDALLALSDPLRRHRRISTVHGVTQARDGSQRIGQRLGLACLRTMHRTVFVSQQTRATLGGKLKHAAVVPNGIDLAAVQEVRSQPVSKTQQRINILAVGRLAHEKNYALLVDAVAELTRGGVPCQLTHLGDGPLADELKRHVTDLGLQNVDFAGYSTEVLQQLHQSDVLAFTSRSEAMPIAILEAMLLGVPVVAPAVGGIPEMFEEYPLGVLFPEATAERVAATIRDTCSVSERIRASAEDIGRAEAKYSAEAMAQGYRAVYGSVLRGD